MRFRKCANKCLIVHKTKDSDPVGRGFEYFSFLLIFNVVVSFAITKKAKEGDQYEYSTNPCLYE